MLRAIFGDSSLLHKEPGTFTHVRRINEAHLPRMKTLDVFGRRAPRKSTLKSVKVRHQEETDG
jgi:hypothetical protein